MIGIAFPHENPSQIRVVIKFYSHHIVSLTFLPICRGPDVDETRHRLVFFNSSLNPQMYSMLEAIKLINNLKTRFFTQKIDCCHIQEHIKRHAIASIETNGYQYFLGNKKSRLSP